MVSFSHRMLLGNKAIMMNIVFAFMMILVSTVGVFPTAAYATKACDKTVYLSFDTGNMSVAQYVADTLRKQQVVATFFLANEKTYRADMALDESWKSFWQSLVADGHAFGSHTLNHTYFQKDGKNNDVILKPQFGPNAGKVINSDQLEVCRQIKSVDPVFNQLTGSHIDKIWRAPGGKVSPRLIQMSKACGYEHIGWSDTGFLGDELSSTQYSNQFLLQRALDQLKDGDIAMAHLGIWSRKDPWATGVLEPLIIGLKQKGFCFATVSSK